MNPIQYRFDVTNIDPYVGGGGEPLPAGWYVMAITNMEVKANNKKDGQETGHNLFDEYTVRHGDLKGRKLFENLNLWHKLSTAAVEIAEKQLSSIGHAVGIVAGEDLTVLANKDMLVEVGLDAAKPDTQNPNTGEMEKGRAAQNRIIQRKPATPENIALHIEGQSLNSGAAPIFAQQAQAAAAQSAPAFNPAASQAQSAAPIQAAQQAPAFTQQAQQAAPNAAPVNGSGPAVPPWQK